MFVKKSQVERVFRTSFINKMLILFFTVFSLSFGGKYPVENIHRDIDTLFEIVSDTHEIRVGNHDLKVDVRRLLLQTAMVESNFARDKYKGRVAKTYMQIEEKTAKWYLSQVPELREYIEERLDRKLVWYKDRDAMFVAYLIYMSKIRTHHSWIDKYRHSKHFQHGDIEYFVYKLFFNSIKGASTYSRFVSREKEYYDLKFSENNS